MADPESNEPIESTPIESAPEETSGDITDISNKAPESDSEPLDIDPDDVLLDIELPQSAEDLPAFRKMIAEKLSSIDKSYAIEADPDKIDFHIMDYSDPSNPTEIEIGDPAIDQTLRNFVVKLQLSHEKKDLFAQKFYEKFRDNLDDAEGVKKKQFEDMRTNDPFCTDTYAEHRAEINRLYRDLVPHDVMPRAKYTDRVAFSELLQYLGRSIEAKSHSQPQESSKSLEQIAGELRDLQLGKHGILGDAFVRGDVQAVRYFAQLLEMKKHFSK